VFLKLIRLRRHRKCPLRVDDFCLVTKVAVAALALMKIDSPAHAALIFDSEIVGHAC